MRNIETVYLFFGIKLNICESDKPCALYIVL